MATRYVTALDAEVRAVLERSTISATSVTLPEQLPRELYQRVNKVLIAAGGKWDRRAGAHLFDRDPRERLGLALEEGSIQDERRVNQQFFTPPALAERMCQEACVSPGHLVLEPSAGSGVIAKAARARGAEVVCVERDPALCEQLEAAGFRVVWGDFLAQWYSPQFDGGYSAVLMNPPFANGQAVRHVMHAIQFVTPGGFLVAIVPQPAAVTVLELPELAGWDTREEPLPDDTFKEAGSGVRTTLLTLWRLS